MKAFKKIGISIVVAFSLIGAGGVVAYGADIITVSFGNIQKNYNLTDKGLVTIEGMLVSRDKKIEGLTADNDTLTTEKAQLATDKAGLVAERDLLAVTNNQLNGNNGTLQKDLTAATELNTAYAAQIDKAVERLQTFNDAIDETNGTKHKLNAALALIEGLSADFGEHVGLGELKDTLDKASQVNLDLEQTDVLMEDVKTTTEGIIKKYNK